MNNKMFFNELIFLDQSFEDANSFFDTLFPVLKHYNYVHDSFLAAIKQREHDYPTALPLTPFAVALPHTDTEHIIKPFIAVTRLNHTMPWYEMANNDNQLSIKLIFLLGFIDRESHIELLQILIEQLNNEYFINQLHQTKTVEETIQLLESTFTFNQKRR